MPFMPFKTRPGFYYVYDMNKNSVYKTSEQQYEVLRKINDVNIDGVATLEGFQKRGLLAPSPILKVEHPASNFLEHQMKSCVSTITFQMSQNCNLRCEYCPYSDNAIYDNRKRTDKDITWDIVEKGIDFLFNNSSDVENR